MSHLVRIRAQQRIWLRDPLARRLFSSDHQRRFVHAIAAGDEGYLRAPNKGGKTEVGAATFVGMAQGRESLDGRTIREAAAGIEHAPVLLPLLRTPCVLWLIVESYKAAVDGSIAAIRQALGDWPHDTWSAGANQIGGFRIQPKGQLGRRDLDNASRIVLQVGEGADPAGGRIDGAWADEVPPEKLWRETRHRGRGVGAPFYRGITATPKYRKQWYWLRKDFADHPERKCEIVMPFLANEALLPSEIAEAKRLAAGDDLERARLYAEYVDTTGTCPFNYAGLQKWMTRARPGTPWANDARVETWWVPNMDKAPELDRAYVLADPSGGIRDEKGTHDPAGIWVVGQKSGRGWARFNGYVGTIELGRMAGRLAEFYSRGMAQPAIIVPFVTGGYGEALLAGIDETNWPHVWRDQHEDRLASGPLRRRGWHENSTNRNLAVAALQRAVLEDSFDVPSREAIECLMACQVDEEGTRVEGAPGVHDEDLVLLGVAAYLSAKYRPEVVNVRPKPKDMPEALADHFGLPRTAFRPKRNGTGVDRW